TGGHATCATSLTTACDIRDPFAYTGCNNVEGIAGVRVMYCETPATAWDEECMDTTHGAVTMKRGDACLKFGIDTTRGGHVSCVGNTLAESSCASNPFHPANRGCAILTEFPMIVKTYCRDTNPRNRECRAKTSAWGRSFGAGKAPPARLDDTNPRRQFLMGLATRLDTTGTTSIPANGNIFLTLDSARYNGEPLGGTRDVSDGVAAFFDNSDTNNGTIGFYYAGILSGTDLGAPLKQATGTGTWYGQISTILVGFRDINKKDFVLKITFGAKAGVDGSAGSIEGIVQSDTSSSTNHYQLTGTYDAGGVITGEVIFGAFTGSLAQDNLATTVPPNGILTGLIGEQGAVGVFLAADAGSTKDNIIGATSGGYVGGFVAAPALPDVDHAAWVASFGANPPLLLASNLAPTTGNKFLQGKETGLNTTGLGDFTADSFNFDSATYNGMFFGGSATNGVAFQYGNIEGKRYYYAGLLSGTNLGLPLSAVTNATWYGRIVVLQNRAWYGTAAGKIYGDIDLTVNYDGNNNGTIHGS
ncbi:MAG: hypothetical protein K8953_02750, partial [Proteobacteria bacterium]|nr:hypothetical protein [Pseudomonadota bacterium]